MKKFIVFVLTLTTIITIGVRSMTATYAANTNSLKLLAIGNSFSEDATEYMGLIASDLDIKEFVIGNAYIGGCTLDMHAANAKNNEPAYRYTKIQGKTLMSNAEKQKNVTLDEMLRDQDWDIISLQQGSKNSGKPSTYNEDLDYLIEYVKERCPSAKLAWHMTWSYQSDYSSSSFTYYKNDQLYMYKRICDAVQTKIEPSGKFDYIIPTGTAIQNARTGIGDKLNRDGIHLDLYIGRYIAGLSWFKAFGYSLDSIQSLPSRVRKTDLPLIKEVIESAIICPYQITEYGTSPIQQPDPQEEQSGTPETLSPETDVQKAPEDAKNKNTLALPLAILGTCLAVGLASITIVKKFFTKR